MIFPKPTSYYEKGFKRSPALERATAPFRVRNTLTGLGLIAFCGTVCTQLSFFFFSFPLDNASYDMFRHTELEGAGSDEINWNSKGTETDLFFPCEIDAYSIMAVRQDDFSDIKLPNHIVDQKTGESSAPSTSS